MPLHTFFFPAEKYIGRRRAGGKSGKEVAEESICFLTVVLDKWICKQKFELAQGAAA